jgi:hypothetical protein
VIWIRKKTAQLVPSLWSFAHFTPVFEDLINPRPEAIPVLVAGGTTPYTTHSVSDV